MVVSLSPLLPAEDGAAGSATVAPAPERPAPALVGNTVPQPPHMRAVDSLRQPQAGQTISAPDAIPTAYLLTCPQTIVPASPTCRRCRAAG